MTKYFTDEVDLNEINYKLLCNIYNEDKKMIAKMMELEDLDGVEFIFCDETKRVTIKYMQSKKSEYEAGDLKIQLLQLTGLWKNFSLKIPREGRKNFLSSDIGQSYITQFNKVPIAKVNDVNIYGFLQVRDDNLSVGTNSTDGSLIKSKLDRDLHEEVISVNEVQAQLINTEKWENLVMDVKAKIYIENNVKNVMLVGSKDDVITLKKQVEHFFDIEASTNKKMSIDNDQYKLLCKLQKKNLFNSILPAESKLNEDHILLTGTKIQVDKNEKLLKKNFFDKLQRHSFDVDVKGLKAEPFYKEHGAAVDLLESVESKFDCHIIVTDKKKEDIDKGEAIMKWFEMSDHDESFGTDDNDDGSSDDTASSSSPSSITSVRPNIQVINGDITRSKDSEILVNVLYSPNQDHCGVICREFNKACDNNLFQDLKNQGFPNDSDPFITDVKDYKNLNCRWLYHIYLNKKVPLQKSGPKEIYKLLKEKILKCLKNAKIQNCTSIAFPTLGCGNLKYDPKEVCRSFIYAAREFKEPIEIKIYTIAADVVKTFNKVLNEKLNKIDTKGKIITSPKTYGKQHSTRIERLEDKIVTFTFLTLNKDIAAVEDSIKQKVKNLCGSISIEHKVLSDIAYVTDECKLKLIDIISPVSFNLDGSKFKIFGVSNDLVDVKNKICGILDEQKYLDDLEYIKKNKGMEKYCSKCLKYPVDFVHFPKYWKSEEKKGPQKIHLSSTDERYKAIYEMTMNTWDASKAQGIGADATGLAHSNIEIQSISQVENCDLYRDYFKAKKSFMTKYLQKRLVDLGQNKPKTSGFGKYLNDLLDEKLNEVYLFHGTKAQNVDIVINNGIDSRFSSDVVLFGRGAYFAECSTKADQYADDKVKREPIGTKMSMILSRVLLGNPYICEKPKKFMKPPCAEPLCDGSEICTKHSNFHDSIIGTHNVKNGSKVRLLFKEFVIHDRTYCYPEFLIEYIRK